MASRAVRWLLLLGALAGALAGQYNFAKRPNYFWDGVVLYTLGAMCLLALLAQPPSRKPRPPAPAPRSSWGTWVRGGLIALGLILGAAVVFQLTSPQKDYWPLFWIWGAAMGLYLLAFARRPEWTWRGFGQAFRRDGWEWALVLLLLLGAFALRAWRIDTIPWTLGGDEGSQGLWARDVIEGKLINMFGTGWLSVPNLSFFWQAAWLKMAGDNVVGLRLPWAVVGALTVLGVYLLVRRLFDRSLALLTAFLLATYHFHIHYSRLGSNQVADPLFTVWALYFLVVAWQARGAPAAPEEGGGQGEARGDGREDPASTRRVHWAWAASGVVAGLAFYFYAGSRQVPVILAAVLLWVVLTERGFLQAHFRSMLAMLGGFAIVAGPMGLFALQHPNDFNARLNQVGIFQSGWLDREVKITGRTRLSLLAEQVRKAFLAFNLYRDRVVWYGPSMPLMDFLSSVFFALGAVLGVARVIRPDRPTTEVAARSPHTEVAAASPQKPAWRYAVFVLWFGLVIVLGGVLTENPPSSQRLVSSAAPAVFFVALALRELARVFADLVSLPTVGRTVLVAGLAVVLALTGLRYYFGLYQEAWVYGSFNGEVATRIGYHLRDLGPEWQEYFFGAPRMYADFGSTPFIAKGIKLYDVKQPLTGPPQFVDRNRNAIFIFLPERIRELQLVQQAFPGGQLEEVHRIGKPNGPLLYTAYKVRLR